MAIPLLMLPIIIFQFLATYYMAMVIVGMAFYLVGFLLAELQHASSRGSLPTHATYASRVRAVFKVKGRSCSVATSLELSGLLLMTAGIVLELTLGELGVYLKFSGDYLLLAKTLVSFVLNTTLSRLVTVMCATKVGAPQPMGDERL